VANPHLTHSWTRLKFKIHWRGDWHEFDLRPDSAPNFGHLRSEQRLCGRYSEITLSSLAKMADEEGLPFDQQANDAIRVCRVGSR